MSNKVGLEEQLGLITHLVKAILYYCICGAMMTIYCVVQFMWHVADQDPPHRFPGLLLALVTAAILSRIVVWSYVKEHAAVTKLAAEVKHEPTP